MKLRTLGSTPLTISPIVFGGNVFGWTVDETQSFRLLDRAFEAGITAIDTADVYSRWVPSNSGGESETIIGDWLAANPGKREKIQLFTKVGMDMGEGQSGLSRRWITRAVEQSLSRLKTDYIDLYFAHKPDADTPQQETLEAFASLIEQGKVRRIGASNFSREQLEEALALSSKLDLPRYEVLQPEYSMVSRHTLEGPLADFTAAHDIGVVSYFSLASGFLSGKYRSLEDLEGSARGPRVKTYIERGGLQVLDALDEVAAQLDATPAEVAIAWLLHRPEVTAPIASATKLSQLESLIKAASLSLDASQMSRLNQASEGIIAPS